MSISGVTRRIDELGRIVIPKEIRYNLGIREGEVLEIFANDNNIIIKKFSQIKNIKSVSENICELISEVFNINILISDREKIVASNNNRLINNMLTDKMKSFIDNREIYISKEKEQLFNIEGYFYMLPIVTSTDSSGLIIIVSDKNDNESIKYAKMAQKLIIYKLEVD